MPKASFAESESTCFISEQNWDHALSALSFQGSMLVFYWSRSFFMVFQGSRFVFHGSKWVLWFFKVSGWFFEVPGGF